MKRTNIYFFTLIAVLLTFLSFEMIVPKKMDLNPSTQVLEVVVDGKDKEQNDEAVYNFLSFDIVERYPYTIFVSCVQYIEYDITYKIFKPPQFLRRG